MAHLNGHNLTTWDKGDQLRAADLNANFSAIAEMAAQAMTAAHMPDQATVMLEMALAAQAKRIEALENLTAMHARQRNEKEWAPLSHVGGLVVMVNDVQRKFEAAVQRLDDTHARLGIDHDDLHRRLARIEQQPDSATQEDFAALRADHERLTLKEHMLLAQIVALRHEVRVTRDLAMAKDRVANRLEFAPMSFVGHLLQRIREIEERLA